MSPAQNDWESRRRDTIIKMDVNYITDFGHEELGHVCLKCTVDDCGIAAVRVSEEGLCF